MHDFSCWNPDDMNYDLLREATRFYKENPKGVEIACKAFEDTRDKAREQTLLDCIKALMDNLKLSAKQAMEALNIPLSEQEKFASKL